MNTVTGQIAHPDVNADNAASVGHRSMENVKVGCPYSSYWPIGKLVISWQGKSL